METTNNNSVATEKKFPPRRDPDEEARSYIARLKVAGNAEVDRLTLALYRQRAAAENMAELLRGCVEALNANKLLLTQHQCDHLIACKDALMMHDMGATP